MSSDRMSLVTGGDKGSVDVIEHFTVMSFERVIITAGEKRGRNKNWND